MALEDTILDIQKGIRGGRYINEASISQGIVLRLLGELGWPTYDTEIVAPEYAVEGRRVDYALCHPTTKPQVFIEVKRLGNSGGAETQLFEYAYLIGVPLAVLTDGQEWHFFLPGAAGRYQERRVYKLDILERDVPEVVQRLQRYLAYKNVISGKAIKAAQEDYENVAKKRDIRSTLPIAFKRLFEEIDAELVDLLADKVEDLCGYRPDPDTVTDFLERQVSTPRQTTFIPRTVRRAKPKSQPKPQPKPRHQGPYTIEFLGEEHKVQNASEGFLLALELLAKEDPEILPRFAALPKHGKKRRYVAEAKEDLYPGRPDLVESFSHRLSSGWWVGTNYSTSNKKSILQRVCEVSDLEYGSDLVLNF